MGRTVSAGYRKSAELKERLLDVAEALFAERGFYGTSIRDITDAAQVRSASINYHFQSKENLFLAVIDRRIEPLSALRQERISQRKADKDDIAANVRSIVEAFAEPMFHLSENGGPGWKYYCVLIALLAVQRFWGESEVTRKYDTHASLFVDALQEVFPNADPYRIHCCFQFLLSATLYAVCDNQRLDTLSRGVYTSRDLARLRAPFYDYAVGGIIAAATGAMAEEKKP